MLVGPFVIHPFPSHYMVRFLHEHRISDNFTGSHGDPADCSVPTFANYLLVIVSFQRRCPCTVYLLLRFAFVGYLAVHPVSENPAVDIGVLSIEVVG